MADNYTIKEYIEHAMNDVKDKITVIHEDVKEIKVQTTKTNGRVNSLENHKSWLWGAFAGVLLISGLLGFLIKFWVKENIREWTSIAVEEALKNNVTEINYE